MRLTQARQERGFTQEQMAKLLGIGISTYSTYENAQRSIPAKIAKEISKILKVEQDEFFVPVKFTVSKTSGSEKV